MTVHTFDCIWFYIYSIFSSVKGSVCAERPPAMECIDETHRSTPIHRPPKGISQMKYNKSRYFSPSLLLSFLHWVQKKCSCQQLPLHQRKGFTPTMTTLSLKQVILQLIAHLAILLLWSFFHLMANFRKTSSSFINWWWTMSFFIVLIEPSTQKRRKYTECDSDYFTGMSP